LELDNSVDIYGNPLAHVEQAHDGSWRTHPLGEHLRDVARLAAAFAAPFGGQDWARLAGRWHDLGKFQPAFQE